MNSFPIKNSHYSSEIKALQEKFSKFTKIFLLTSVAILIISTLVFNEVYAQSDFENCGIFEISDVCDASTIFALVVGDIFIGGILGLLFAYFSDRNYRAIKQMVERDFLLSNRRKDFAVRNLKSSIHILIFTIGITKKLTTLYNLPNYVTPKEVLRDKINYHYSRFIIFLDSTRNGLFYSADVLEPEIMYKIEHACIFLNQLHVTFDDNVAIFQQSETGLKKLRHLSRDLSTYRNSTHTFSDLDELESFDIIYDNA